MISIFISSLLFAPAVGVAGALHLTGFGQPPPPKLPRLGRAEVLAFPLANGVRRQGVIECAGVSPSTRPRADNTAGLNSSRSTAGSASDRPLPAALPPGPPLTAQARQSATTIAVAAVDVAGQGFRACSILPEAVPQSHACGRRYCGVIRDSEPLRPCCGLGYRRPVTKVWLFDEACRRRKVDHAGDADRHQPSDRHSPIVPTGHQFLPDIHR